MIDDDKSWAERFIELEKTLYAKSEELARTIANLIGIAAIAIKKEVSSWYSRFMPQEGADYQAAKKLLTKSELSEFKWVINGLMNEAKKASLSDFAKTQFEHAKGLKVVSRLQSLTLTITGNVNKLFSKVRTAIDSGFKDTFLETYNRVAYEVQRLLGQGKKVTDPTKDRIKNVIQTAWTPDGIKSFRRLDINEYKLASVLSQEVTTAVIRGDGLQAAVDAVAKKMNVSQSAAKRFVTTEVAYINAEAQKASFIEQGVAQYQFVAILDNRTTQTCRHMNGKVFKMSEFKPGTTAPPMHCYCRSHTRPYFKTASVIEKLASTNSGPSSFRVRSNMGYEDWYKASH